MLTQMSLQVCLLHKALGAVWTLEGTIACVDALVTLQQRMVECRVAAEATLPQAAPNGPKMHLLILSQAGLSDTDVA